MVEVEVEVVVYMVFVDVVVRVGDVTVVVDDNEVTTPGVVIAAGPILPMAGVLTNETSTIADAINSRKVSVGARKLDLKRPIS